MGKQKYELDILVSARIFSPKPNSRDVTETKKKKKKKCKIYKLKTNKTLATIEGSSKSQQNGMSTRDRMLVSGKFFAGALFFPV